MLLFSFLVFCFLVLSLPHIIPQPPRPRQTRTLRIWKLENVILVQKAEEPERNLVADAKLNVVRRDV